MTESESDCEDYYNVEKILAKEKTAEGTRYLVKWENFPEADCTWEPEENLDNVQDFIEEFNKNKEKEFINFLKLIDSKEAQKEIKEKFKRNCCYNNRMDVRYD